MKNERLKKLNNIDLYSVITSSRSTYSDPGQILDHVLKTPIKIIQLREKNLSKTEKFALAEIFRQKTLARDVLLIINDDIDIALAVKADGVHLGNDDLPLEAARKIAPDLIIGKSTHSLEEAAIAEKQGADYINVGPIFNTPTKEGVKPIGIEIFKEIKEKANIPVTVMGGINHSNIGQVCQAGADKIGMVGAIISKDIEKSTEKLYQTYRQYFPVS
jgi:thiamine-phosphate pyrophosphorylase